jgi:hypothetical protein
MWTRLAGNFGLPQSRKTDDDWGQGMNWNGALMLFQRQFATRYGSGINACSITRTEFSPLVADFGPCESAVAAALCRRSP